MNTTLATYGVYLLVSIALTVWVARTLFRNGRIFLVDVFHGNEPLADSVNRLLVVGFYLINFGYVSLALKLHERIGDATGSVEALSYKVGFVLVVLGGMHFLNLFVFSRIRHNAQLARAQRPVAPDARIPPGAALVNETDFPGSVMTAPTAEALSLTVYFDDGCSFCRRVARWLDRQPQLVPIHCVGARSEAAQRCPLDPQSLLEEVTVVASDGAVYRGTKAWIVCLWALASYRGWSLRLSSEAAMPWARRIFGLAARFGRVTKSANER